VPHRSQPLNPPTSSISPAATKNRESNGRTTGPSPSVSSFLPGSAQNVECDVTHSKQTVGEFLPGARIGQCCARISIAKPLSNRECDLLESSPTYRKQTVASRPNRELSTNPCGGNSHALIPVPQFLTGSQSSQTEFTVTHSKQTTRKSNRGQNCTSHSRRAALFLGQRTYLRHPRRVYLRVQPLPHSSHPIPSGIMPRTCHRLLSGYSARTHSSGLQRAS
jgi:hypothetical protein